MTILGGSGQYLVVMGQYGAVLVGTWWYWVSITWCCLVLKVELGYYKAFMPVYIEKVEIWSDVTIAGRRTSKK